MVDKPLDSAPAPRDFAETLEHLEALVSRLESGSLSLEESLTAFEQGVGLSRDAQQRLDAAELKVQQLIEQADGKLTKVPFSDTGTAQ